MARGHNNDRVRLRIRTHIFLFLRHGSFLHFGRAPTITYHMRIPSHNNVSGFHNIASIAWGGVCFEIPRSIILSYSLSTSSCARL